MLTSVSFKNSIAWCPIVRRGSFLDSKIWKITRYRLRKYINLLCVICHVYWIFRVNERNCQRWRNEMIITVQITTTKRRNIPSSSFFEPHFLRKCRETFREISPRISPTARSSSESSEYAFLRFCPLKANLWLTYD